MRKPDTGAACKPRSASHVIAARRSTPPKAPQQALDDLGLPEDLVTEIEGRLRSQHPFAKVVKARGSLGTMFGMFNMRKTGSPWRDAQLRQAVNMAINRTDLIRYAAKGNGVIVPALVPAHGFGYDPDLAPYPFDPNKASRLQQEAGYPDGMPLALIAPQALEVQATVVSKMLEQAGFTVDLQLLAPAAYNRRTFLSDLEQPPEQQVWDLALMVFLDAQNFPAYLFYLNFALDGVWDWVLEQPKLRQLYERVLRTVDEEHQQGLIRQMERHAHAQAYFLFLYNPINLYAVNKAVEFIPHVTGTLILTESGVTKEHWSVRNQKAMVDE